MKKFIIMAMAAAMALGSCEEKGDSPDNPYDPYEPQKSDECDILYFTAEGWVWDINGLSITCAYEPYMEERPMAPVISLSPGATIDPPADMEQDFFNPQGIIYTVTAEDGVTTKTYRARATRTPFSECEILSFVVNDRWWDIGWIDYINDLFGVSSTYQPEDIEEIPLTPIITLSPGATVVPASGVAQDFFNPEGVTYTVTAEDGVTTKTYLAKAIRAASGTTGECTWVLTGTPGNYTFTISGNGAMENYRNHDEPWYKWRSYITTVIIQDGVTTIGNQAFFHGYDSLTSVTIPNSVTAIGEYAFFDCSGLTEITIPNSVRSIGGGAFSGCTGLTSVIIPNSVTYIGGEYDYNGGVFENCTGLTSVTIPNSVEIIGKSAFYGCTGLTEITLPNSVTTIGNEAFYGCTGLTGALIIPNSVTTIGYKAFSGCTGLTNVTIGSSVEAIGDRAFYGCTALTEINVDPDNACYASEEGAVFNKDKTMLIRCPGGKTSYIIPNSVININDGIVNNTEGAFSGCTGLTEIIIPNSVEIIGKSAFSGCTGLTSVTIGNSVTSIGNYAFYGCTGLTEITCLCTTPPRMTLGYSNIFVDVDQANCVLRVPAGSVISYRHSWDEWEDFENIVPIE